MVGHENKSVTEDSVTTAVEPQSENKNHNANGIQWELQHHGAAAAISGNQAVTWMPQSDTVVYASHALLNLAVRVPVRLHADDKGEEEEEEEEESTVVEVRHVETTLRTLALEQGGDSASVVDGTNASIITTVVNLKHRRRHCHYSPIESLVSGFSNGMIQIWTKNSQTQQWKEHAIIPDRMINKQLHHITTTTHNNHPPVLHSITVLDGIWISDSELWIVAGTSAGATLYQLQWQEVEDHAAAGTTTTTTTTTTCTEETFQLIHTMHLSDHVRTSVFSVHFGPTKNPTDNDNEVLDSVENPLVLLIGTAAPRHNKIHVYHYNEPGPLSAAQSNNTTTTDKGTPPSRKSTFQYVGVLSGHENWITDLAFFENEKSNAETNEALLASASHDCRIRLWKFRTSVPTINSPVDEKLIIGTAEKIPNEDNDDDDDDDDDFQRNEEVEDDEEGESRLEIISLRNNDKSSILISTSVTLEAILYGHEESVTSVTWHPKPMTLYGVAALLISSSMDRTILLWTESTTDGGVWTPLTRVGSAGGILGGSVGSSLLGFCKVLVEPIHGRTLLGHAYGGTIHAWELDQMIDDDTTQANDLSPEERASHVQWKAAPCITGHFRGVTDLCWEASSGEYLLSVSNDQTCRLWAPVSKVKDGDGSRNEKVWVELARPQVHGYNLSTIASLSTERHPHLMVTGADEKEIRAFDAPNTFVRVLKAVSGIAMEHDEAATTRVERAFIPSLGLSNKASATEAAEEDSSFARNPNGLDSLSVETVKLPLERDLGAVSLWPEVQKLFGHNTEIYCLTSMQTARTSRSLNPVHDNNNDYMIVASSAKARDEKDAAIRLWDVTENRCIQILVGGHKSTVATLAFSPDGRFLASSGKDRRLCLWRRELDNPLRFSLAWAKDSAHKRIIWSVHFRPFGTPLLASGSRDGAIKIWSITDDDGSCAVGVGEIHNFAPHFHRSNGKPDAVTALSFAPLPYPGDSDAAVLSVGLESGRIELWKVVSEHDAPEPFFSLEPSVCHIASVTKLVWRPFSCRRDQDAGSNGVNLCLASSSMDNGCRIFKISFTSNIPLENH
jgi:elongator complex protein 2